MTKKETLKHFKTWCQQTLGNNCSDKDFDMANNIMALLEQEPCEMTVCEDTISRQAVIDGINEYFHDDYYQRTSIQDCRDCLIKDVIKDMPSVTPKPNRWIPVSERLPDNTDPVSITWVNHDPESYYADIKDKPFTATGHYCNGRWWWYSATCQDYLKEYGRCDVDAVDDDIEVIAWMPLPEPMRMEKQ